MLCRLLGHQDRHSPETIVLDEVRGEWRSVLVVYQCQRCKRNTTAKHVEIDKVQFPGGIEQWLETPAGA